MLRCILWRFHEVTAFSIVDKLTALDWGDEIDKIPAWDALTTHKLVKVPQLLTDRIWANISGPIIEYMEKMKVNRLACDLEKLRPQGILDVAELLRRYKTKCAPFTNVSCPNCSTSVRSGPIKEIIEPHPSNSRTSFRCRVQFIPTVFPNRLSRNCDHTRADTSTMQRR